MLGTVNGWLGASGDDPTVLYKVGLSSRRILLALGDLVVGWLLQKQAEVALAALGRGDVSERDRLFYQGKVAKWMIPDDVVFVAELPHTATGKLSKLTLRRQMKDYKLPGV